MDQIVLDHIDKCSQSFDYFVRNELGATPNEDQQEFIDAFQAACDGTGKEDISGRSGHGTGKTASLAWSILWVGLTKEDAKIPTTAPVAAQLKNLLIPEVGKWVKKMSSDFQGLVEVQTMDVKFHNGNACFARTASKDNTESLAGVHASFVYYVIDEASGIDQAVFDVIEGALTGNYVRVMFSNPTRTIGTFYDSHHKNRSMFKTLHFSSETSSNVKPAWIKKMADKYGVDSDVYRVRVKGDFPKANTSGLFSLDELENAQNRLADTAGAVILGIDVARFGNDSSVHCVREGLQVEEFETRQKNDTVQVASWSAFKFNKVGADAAIIDTIGVGGGVFDQMRKQGYYVIDGNFSSDADDKKTYLNKRAECYFRLKEAIGIIGLPSDEELIEELLAINYSFTESGRIKIESKELIKENLGRSPDKSDSLALTFFTTVHSNREYVEASEGGSYYGDDYYEPNNIV